MDFLPVYVSLIDELPSSSFLVEFRLRFLSFGVVQITKYCAVVIELATFVILPSVFFYNYASVDLTRCSE
jgi:hypothetical protein